MKVDFIVNQHPEVTRIAVMEDGRLMELIVEMADDRHIVGNIYLGKVNAVLPGMQAAFVDIGLERSAFLHVSDVREMLANEKSFARALIEGKPPRADETRRPIEKVLEKGQRILVQVTKEPIGTKGARVSTRISIAGRYVVSMPGDSVAGVSRKITDRQERSRLRKIVQQVRTEGFGIIARTAGIEKDEDSFRTDVERIVNKWKEIGTLTVKSKAPALLHQEHDLITMTVRDLVSPDVNSIVSDSRAVAKQIKKYLKTFDPDVAAKVKYYRGKTPIFDQYGIEKEISGLVRREVLLKSGGSIVIDHTEALVAIDVNTKRYVGRRRQEDTIFKTNMEAAREVARQLRLRDLGGIIVIDFIDMDNLSHRDKVVNCLRGELGRDRSPTKTCQVSPMGLVEMTRKRVRPSLVQSMSVVCEYCTGTGRIQTPVSVLTEIERFLERAANGKKHVNLVVTINPMVAKYLMEDDGRRLEYLTARSDRLSVHIHEDDKMLQAEFKVFSLDSHEEITDLYLPGSRA
ncbi:MAG: Rne/Rng family ribonuclease [Candidatus Fermentibacteraceae bacterium]|nr:Rne/Rng family ribonuclease [Candidatus Fermentibacteraceae bacterium]